MKTMRVARDADLKRGRKPYPLSAVASLLLDQRKPDLALAHVEELLDAGVVLFFCPVKIAFTTPFVCVDSLGASRQSRVSSSQRSGTVSAWSVRGSSRCN